MASKLARDALVRTGSLITLWLLTKPRKEAEDLRTGRSTTRLIAIVCGRVQFPELLNQNVAMAIFCSPTMTD